MKVRVRGLVVLLAAVAFATAPLSADAQPSGKPPRIGFIFLTSPAQSSPFIEAFRASLKELGYVDGRNVVIELRSAEGRAERLPALAAELVDRKVDLIVSGGGNLSALAARKATSTIPIVMTSSVGAVEAGLVASLARPGANVTGLTVPRQLGLKQLELLREILPSLSRVTVFTRSGFETTAQRDQSKAMAQQFLGVTLDFVDIQEAKDLPPAFTATRTARPNAMIVGPDPLFFNERDQLLEFARTSRIPAIYPFRTFVEAGGLISYSLSSQEVSRVVARFVDRILKGAKPADLPVEQPTTLELVINAKTAKSLGLTIPPVVMLRADQVIE